MKLRFSNPRSHAMTLVEVLVVIVVLAVLVVVLLPGFQPHAEPARRISCVNNLKEIGLAYHLWSEDHQGKFPMQVSVTNGGAMELIATGNVAACFQVISNELSMPMILHCPADMAHIQTRSFAGLASSNISYFVGVDVTNEMNPQMIVSGDDNFTIGGTPVKSGLLELSTNSAIAWTSGRHFSYKEHFWTPTHEIGNIGLCDGSVQIVTISGLANLLHQTGLAASRLAIP